MERCRFQRGQARRSRSSTRVELALDNPAENCQTAGARSPFLDTYLRQYTVDLPDGPASFTISSVGRR